MVYRIITALTLSVTTSLGLAATGENQPAVRSEPRSDFQAHVPAVNPRVVEYKKQMAVKGTMPIAYWDDVSICETNGDWYNTGSYAGGLGIYTKGKLRNTHAGTWERYGGEEFAPTPNEATKLEQIIIANRITVLGYTYTYTANVGYKGAPMTFTHNQKPVGFTGFGCIKTHKKLQPKHWRDANRGEWVRGKKNVQ